MGTLTAQTVRDIVALADDDLVTELVETGASEAELMAALAWLDEDDQAGKAGVEAPAGQVAQLCSILQAARDTGEDERRG